MSNITITLPSGQTLSVPLPPDAPTTLPPQLVEQIQNTINQFAPREAKAFEAALKSGNFTKFNRIVLREVRTILDEAENYPCFCNGTLIRTTRGDVPVESLNVGDLVVTISGTPRPITWLGQRTMSAAALRAADMPVRIRAGAFGQGLPFADLRMSPGHHICINMLGEILLSASRLINGSTIVQEAVSTTTYWHVELESHDIILANGLPTESFLDCNNRDFFVGDGVRPDVFTNDAAFCRPVLHDEILVRALRSRLRSRAIDLGWSIDNIQTQALLHGAINIVPQVSTEDGLSVARWKVPLGATGVRLHGPTFQPYHTTDQIDLRRLGLRICRITVGEQEVSLDDLQDDGFHKIEQGTWRWTKDSAALPDALFAGAGQEVIELTVSFGNHTMPIWVEPVGRARPALSLVA